MTATDRPESVHLRDGEAAVSDGRWLDALDHYRQARDKNPVSSIAWQGLSIAHHHLGHPEEAWDAAVEAWKLDPSDPDNEPNLRDLATEQGRLDELDRLLSPTPQEAESFCRTGESRVEAGRCPEAVQSFLQALDVEPSLARAWSGIGVACFRQGMNNASRAFFEMAVRLDPTDEDAVLNWTETSQTQLTNREIEHALESMGVGTALRTKATSTPGA